MENLILIGTGINASKALEFVNKYNLFNVIGFAVNQQYYKEKSFCGLPVYKLETIKEEVKVPFKVFVAVLWNRLNKDRRILFEYCNSNGFDFVNLISPSAIVYESAKLGFNCWIDDQSCIQTNCTIGNNVFIRAQAVIGSNTTINDHVFIGIHSTIGGGSNIGVQSFIGLNALILDSVSVGEKCIIGAGTVIKRNLPDYSKCMVDSENYIIKQYPHHMIEEKLLFSKNVR